MTKNGLLCVARCLHQPRWTAFASEVNHIFQCAARKVGTFFVNVLRSNISQEENRRKMSEPHVKKRGKKSAKHERTLVTGMQDSYLDKHLTDKLREAFTSKSEFSQGEIHVAKRLSTSQVGSIDSHVKSWGHWVIFCNNYLEIDFCYRKHPHTCCVVISQTHWLVSQERLSPRAGTSIFIDLPITPSGEWWF